MSEQIPAERNNDSIQDRPVRRFFGYTLATVGVLICLTAGLCSGCILLFVIPSARIEEIGMLILYGGIPLAAGIGCIYSGRFLIRTSRVND